MNANVLLLLCCLSACLPAKAQEWKAAAEAAIRQHRMAPVRINVLDDQGNAVENARVALKMRRHAFKWGTAVNIQRILELERDGVTLDSDHPYLTHLLNFNSVTPENAGKWQFWLDGSVRSKYLEVMDWLNSKEVQNRGHTTIWPSISRWNAVPAIITNAQPVIENGVVIKTKEEVVRERIRAHIEQQLPILTGRSVYEIDLVNELVNEGEIVRDILGLPPEERPAEHAQWYKWAKAAAPAMDLVANEYNLFQSGNNFHRRFVDYIRAMQSYDAPVDAIGMQGHFFQPIPSYQELKRRLSEVAVLGLPMAVTEFDMNQTGYAPMERVLYAVFSEPLAYGFHLWGAWDGRQWRGNGAIFEEDWTIKDSGRAWFDLVKDTWWTDTTAVTGADGAFQTRAFLGDYDLYVEYQDSIIARSFSLDTAGAGLEISLSETAYPIPEADLRIDGDKTEFLLNEPLRLSIATTDSLESVTFYNGVQVLIRDDSPPFGHTFTVTEPTTLSLSAEVRFANGYRLRTPVQNITVVDANAAPVIQDIFPPLGATLAENSGIDLYVSADDRDDDPITAILFDDNDVEIARTDSLPLILPLNDLAPGVNYLRLRLDDGRFGFDELFLLYTVVEADDNLTVAPPAAFAVNRTGDDAGAVTWRDTADQRVLGYKFFFEGEELPLLLSEPAYELTGLDPDREYTVQVQTIGRFTVHSELSDPFTFVLAEAGTTNTNIFRTADLNIYPNPASGQIYLDDPQRILKRLQIIDPQGRVVKTIQPPVTGEPVIDISTLPAGPYFIRAWTKEGGIGYLKLIKQ